MNRTGQIGSQSQWKRLRQHALAATDQRIPRSNTRGFHLHEDFAVAGLGLGNVFQRDDFRRTKTVNSSSFHLGSPDVIGSGIQQSPQRSCGTGWMVSQTALEERRRVKCGTGCLVTLTEIWEGAPYRSAPSSLHNDRTEGADRIPGVRLRARETFRSPPRSHRDFLRSTTLPDLRWSETFPMAA